MKKENEKTKVKELYNKYKEIKRDPRKKAGLKLLGYFIFFLIIALIANISNEFDTSNKEIKNSNTTTTKIIDSYVEKQNDLLTSKYNINYKINYNDVIYNINGIIEDNIINGYLEKDNIIKKITIKNNEIYENEVILESGFNVEVLDLNNIIKSIKQTSAFIKEKEDIKTYLYEFDNKKIYVECNEKYIVSIKIEENNNYYILNFDK